LSWKGFGFAAGFQLALNAGTVIHLFCAQTDVLRHARETTGRSSTVKGSFAVFALDTVISRQLHPFQGREPLHTALALTRRRIVVVLGWGRAVFD